MTNWKDRRVLVTGASAGLGLHIAREFLSRAASVAIVGRNEESLHSTAESLRANAAGGAVLPLAGDVTNDADVATFVEELKSHWGGLDVLVNNVGVSARGRLLDVSPEAFTQSLEINLLSTVRMTRAFVPVMPDHSHIVNIGSLAAKTAGPLLGPYVTAKHALAGYSHQLRLEHPELHVLLACPGPIARPDSGERYAEQTTDLPELATRPGGGVKIKGLDPQWLARQIVSACEKRRLELIVPFRAKVLIALSAVWPSLGDWIIRKMT